MISVSQNQRLNLQYANNIFKFSAYAYQYTSSFSEQKYYNCLRRCSAFSNPNLERGWEDPCPSQEHEVITEDLLQCQYLPLPFISSLKSFLCSFLDIPILIISFIITDTLIRITSVSLRSK